MNITNRNFHRLWKTHGFIIELSLLLLIVALMFRVSFYGFLGEQNYLTFHLIMEFFITTTALTIAIQSWMVFPHNLSNYRLWIGALFFSIALLELAHMITYNGMPYFFGDSSAFRATWFFMVARLTEVSGILIIVAFKDRRVPAQKRIVAYGIALIYSVIWMVVLFNPEPLLPELVIDGFGTTELKKNLQYTGIILELIVIVFAVSRFQSKDLFNTMLIVASIYLITSDYLFTTYKSVYDINNFLGHLFQFAGFYFLQRAGYHSAVEEPFQKQKEAENLLKQNEKFLQTITSHMGEGLIVLDNYGNTTFMNLEAERLIQWKDKEIVGKNFHDLVHKKFEGNNYLFCKYPFQESNQGADLFREEEDYFSKKNGEVFPASYVVTPFFEQDHLAGSIMVFRDITQQKKDREMIQYMAFYDELTELPNTRFLKDRWFEIVNKQPNQKKVMFIIDIDRFKKINEALGHSFGDMILKATANRLKKQLSEQMIIARLTGDEFALILPCECKELEQDVTTIVKQIQDTLREPLQAQTLLVNITVRMGVAVYPDHAESMEELLQRANMALVEAQLQNKSFQFYHHSMDGKALDHLVLENDLYHALECNELFLAYQPQIDIETGEIIGVEALLRWNHPQYGLIPPARFIPIAEDTGLIVPIGEWVLRTACKQVKEWQNQGLPPFVVGVNLSIRQFYQQNLVETVKEILAETKLLPKYLELEITESMMMNMDHTLKTLQLLKELGVQIAIDDFGTGYSSLSYIKFLKVDRLKIDQSFVRDLITDESDTTIVSTIISMAQHLQFTVIAEGIETLKQKEILHKENCKLGQGYLFSPPLSPRELVEQFERIQAKAGAICQHTIHS
ncbi:EAL domain-containing protein [Neobacillus sp. LXY-4]|uniref:bifunctional diguanylate cyclase/phosphodiesterase n=1 Tax=Neobacillus sp. LXY-4 TaxID=3379826 RepID=UPI003EE3BD64